MDEQTDESEEQVVGEHGEGAVEVAGATREAAWTAEALASMGYAVEREQVRLEGEAVRVDASGYEESGRSVEDALETIRDPEAVFFDLDGVLVDVSDSYREAIRRTAVAWDVELSHAEISRAKAAGEANNDWVLLQRLLADEGIDAEVEELRRIYERHYQGEGEEPGLWRHEELLVEPERLGRVGGDRPVGIVTGRPRRDAERLFEHTGLDEAVEAVVCMEDAPQKPRPEPVELLAERMGVEDAWMIGDTPDDANAARAAGMLPFGIVAPEEEAETMRRALRRAGCLRVVEDLDEFDERLP